jgi:hypothetical protein
MRASLPVGGEKEKKKEHKASAGPRADQVAGGKASRELGLAYCAAQARVVALTLFHTTTTEPKHFNRCHPAWCNFNC